MATFSTRCAAVLVPLLLSAGGVGAVKFKSSQVGVMTEIIRGLGYPTSLVKLDCGAFKGATNPQATVPAPALRVTCDGEGYPLDLFLGFPNPVDAAPSLAYLSKIPATLPQLVRLRSLSISNIIVQSSLPSSFGNIPNLTRLSMVQFNILGTIPAAFGNLAKLSYLAIHEDPPLHDITTVLAGWLPASFSKLTALVSFDLAGSFFSGPLPPFGKAQKSLKHLTISNSQFSGRIPNSYSQLTGLTSLDLSGNVLGGQLPPFLTPRTYRRLKTLALANNFFSGRADYFCSLPSGGFSATYSFNCLSSASKCLAGKGAASQYDAQTCDSFCHAGVWANPALPCNGHGTCLPVPNQGYGFLCACDAPYSPPPKAPGNCTLRGH